MLWGSDWDELLARDTSGLLLRRMEECVDGEYQNFKAKGGEVRPQGVLRQVSRTAGAGEGHVSDEELGKLRRGGPRSAKGLQRLSHAR